MDWLDWMIWIWNLDASESASCWAGEGGADVMYWPGVDTLSVAFLAALVGVWSHDAACAFGRGRRRPSTNQNVTILTRNRLMLPVVEVSRRRQG